LNQDRFTYSQLATDIAQYKAAWAVRLAVGSKPVTYLISCHRVIRATGTLGGYHCGPTCKQAMMAVSQSG